LNQLTSVHKTLFQHGAIGDYPKAIHFNLLQLVITIQWVCKTCEAKVTIVPLVGPEIMYDLG
jgi:hypothetical protein